MNAEPGKLVERGTLVFRRVLPGPIDRVWAFLTEPDKRATWLAGGEMELKVGGKVELVFNNNALSPGFGPPEKYRDMGGCLSFTGRVTRCEPPRVLAYTWAESWGDSSEVTFELSTQGDDVVLLLTHRRLGDDREMLISVSAGWHTHLGILVAHLEGKLPKPFWPEHTQQEVEYDARLPNVTETRS